jgi:hypothetical protein
LLNSLIPHLCHFGDERFEHDGWNVGGAWATRKGCGSICIAGGNHDRLRIWLSNASVEGIDRFLAQEIIPGVPLLIDLGFVEVGLVGTGPSNGYPGGFARFSLRTGRILLPRTACDKVQTATLGEFIGREVVNQTRLGKMRGRATEVTFSECPSREQLHEQIRILDYGNGTERNLSLPHGWRPQDLASSHFCFGAATIGTHRFSLPIW